MNATSRAEAMAALVRAAAADRIARVRERELAGALERLPGAWGAMIADQQTETVRQLIGRIGYDHSSGRVTLKLRATAAGTLHRLAGGRLDDAKHNGTAADARNRTRTAVSAVD